MRHLPASPSRSQALSQAISEFEPVLLERFQKLTTHIGSEMRDSMHYVLFSTADRFCISAAWLIAPRLGIPPERFISAACAVETLRCSLSFKLRPKHSADKYAEKYVDSAFAEAAIYGLVPLAFEMLLDPESPLADAERTTLARLVAHSSSPVQLLATMHREARLLREGYRHDFSLGELQDSRLAKVPPAFGTTGEVLAFLSGNAAHAPLGTWFRKLGLFAFWVEEFTADAITLPEAMDLIKSLEADLLERARELGIRDAAHEIIEPLADVLKTRLQ